jgi:hypothetical protein
VHEEAAVDETCALEDLFVLGFLLGGVLGKGGGVDIGLVLVDVQNTLGNELNTHNRNSKHTIRPKKIKIRSGRNQPAKFDTGANKFRLI